MKKIHMQLSSFQIKDSALILFVRLWILVFILERIGRFTFYSYSGPETTVSLESITYMGLLIVTFLNPSNILLVSLSLVCYYLMIWFNNNDHPQFISTIIPFFTHWFLAFIINLTLLIGIISKRTDKSLATIRLIIIFSLMFAGFAKLNHPFLLDQDGCGVVFFKGLLSKFNVDFGLSTLSNYMPSITFFVEFFCPVLLLFKSTRFFSSICIWLLMTMLGFLPSPNTLYDFAGLYLVALLLFQPSSSIKNVQIFIQKLFDYKLFSILFTAGIIVLGTAIDKTFNHKLTNITMPILWACISLIVLFVIIKGRKAHNLLPLKTGIIGFIILALFIYKETLVFLGAPHHSNFNMASSLIISRAYSNHLLIKKVPDLELNKLAKIVYSEDIRLIPGRYFAWHGLKNYLLLNTGKKVVFELEGQITESPLSNSEIGSKSLLYFISNIFNKHIILPQIINTEDQKCKVHQEKDVIYKN